MNRKMVIIISSILGLLVIGTVILLAFTPKSSDTNIREKGYYVEKGIESPATTAKLAVENFLDQNYSETASARRARLGRYFVTDSPVYDYELTNLNSTTKKSTAKVTSVISCPDQETTNWCLIVKADISFYSTDDTTITNSISYWVDFRNDKVYDLGAWKE